LFELLAGVLKFETDIELHDEVEEEVTVEDEQDLKIYITRSRAITLHSQTV
jgi:hypothetical protein